MTLAQGALLVIAGVVAGALNAVAGGGSFLTFPALVFSGVPPIQANATSTVALWPGSLASAAGYRKELNTRHRHAVPLALVSLAGGGLGALLLVSTPQHLFVHLVPFLLLVASLVFTFGDRLTHSGSRELGPTASAVLQLPIAIYGGYFGGGMGLMMLAGFSLMRLGNIHEMNALKSLLAAAINGVAIVTFVIFGLVEWLPALAMLCGAIAGGYLGASTARRLDPKKVRIAVVLLGWAMTLVFFLRDPIGR